jgi:hypothetical protein
VVFGADVACGEGVECVECEGSVGYEELGECEDAVGFDGHVGEYFAFVVCVAEGDVAKVEQMDGAKYGASFVLIVGNGHYNMMDELTRYLETRHP